MSYDSWKLEAPPFIEWDVDGLVEEVYDSLSDFTYNEICAENHWHADDDFEKVKGYIEDVIYDNNFTTAREVLKYLGD